MATDRNDLPSSGTQPGSGTLLPDEEIALEEQIDRVRTEKREALKDPGPSWHDWFFYSAAKWYVLLAFFIVLAWEITYLYPASNTPLYEVLPVMAGTVYGEYLLYQYLWYRPSASSRSTRAVGHGHRWIVPVRYGRWTEEGVALRAGKVVPEPEHGPDAKEFL